MKLPNFRLYDTQAKFATILGVLGVVGACGLAYLVFKGFKADEMTIYYNADSGLGKWRPWMVRAAAGGSILVGLLAGILGFNSLGQKRNSKQNLSWLGLLSGAISLSAGAVLFFAWSKLAETVISG